MLKGSRGRQGLTGVTSLLAEKGACPLQLRAHAVPDRCQLPPVAAPVVLETGADGSRLVARGRPNEAVTVLLVVEDACGNGPTVVGAGRR